MKVYDRSDESNSDMKVCTSELVKKVYPLVYDGFGCSSCGMGEDMGVLYQHTHNIAYSLSQSSTCKERYADIRDYGHKPPLF